MYSIKAPAKLNIFLKITGTKQNKDGKIYHILSSRFVRIEELFDLISFVPHDSERFCIDGCDGVELEKNSIYRAYRALLQESGDLDLIEFFHHHKVVVEKNIPSGAGLGGGSSDAAAFMLLAKEACNLLLETQKLADIAASIGSDVPFFIYGYESANVYGFGEVVEPFEESLPTFKIFTPKIHCDTAKVHQNFDKMSLLSTEVFKYENMSVKEILQSAKTPEELNDLFLPAIDLHTELKEYAKDGYFFSGSGSSFFTI